MTDRIQQLAEQSGALWDDKYHWYVGNEQMKQFAQLIIQECAEICLEANDHANILKHFGIES